MWWCFPHFDSDPVFSRLLAGDEEKGFCDVTLANLVETDSDYMRNTAMVETILTDANGAKVRMADFAPNFERFERVYRPPQIIRRIEPVAGLPRITIRVRPTHNYGRPTTNFVVGSNHIRYLDGAQVLRLTSDAPLSYIVKEISFPLSRPVNLIFGQDDPFLSAIDTTSREFLTACATIGTPGCAISRWPTNGRWRWCARRSRSNFAASPRRARLWRRIRRQSRGALVIANLGLSLLLAA